jgi:hypothetical protein
MGGEGKMPKNYWLRLRKYCLKAIKVIWLKRFMYHQDLFYPFMPIKYG